MKTDTKAQPMRHFHPCGCYATLMAALQAYLNFSRDLEERLAQVQLQGCATLTLVEAATGRRASRYPAPDRIPEEVRSCP